ncbi:MAG TPA: ThuA domain-containing protein [Tepidisphaeraceae bacterium]|nr:ThuA domain-containing protein [Tepidisphaeraceae bacterium]
MPNPISRRQFVKSAVAGTAMTYAAAAIAQPVRQDIRVVVWDEQQKEQKQAYENFLGNAIADHLRGCNGLNVRSVTFRDKDQGLSDDVVNSCDIMIWWSHYPTNGKIRPELTAKLLNRIKQGATSLVTLHSAHWSDPFVEAMRYRTIEDAVAGLDPEQRKSAVITYITPKRFAVPKRADPLTPFVRKSTAADGKLHIEITLPCCVFPAFRADGKPSHVTTLKPEHPLAQGLPPKWDIPQTEMYDEPFHVPQPDETVFEERWDRGEHFRSGHVWKIGKGRVVYFRPGHEIFPVYKQEYPLRVLENACRWLGGMTLRTA